MKKLLCLIAVIALTAPVMAAEGDPNVLVTCNDEGNGVVQVSYQVLVEDEDPGLMRGIALDITASNGALIAGISEYDAEGEPVPADSTQIPAGYSIYMGSVTFAADPNLVANFGDPVAPDTDPDALGGLGTTGITVEMGSLYAEGGTAPTATGDLFKLQIDCNGATETVLTIAANTTRGGCVMESGQQANVVSAGCTIACGGDCFPANGEGGAAAYNNWVSLNKPACWCEPYQCDGDAAVNTSGFPFNYRIFNADINLIFANWKKKIGDPTLNPCADVDHLSSGFPFNYQVFNGDINIVFANWKAKDADLPGNCPR